MFAICVFDGKGRARNRDYEWLVSVVSIIMISLSPLVGSWLNKLEKQGKLEDLWKKICVGLVLAGINDLIAIGVITIINVNLRQYNFGGYFSTLFEISLSVAAGAGFGAAWGWAGTFAGAWVGAWAKNTWAFDLYGYLYHSSQSNYQFYSVAASIGVGVAVVFASQKLLQSIGKWKAMMILLGTGLTGLGVGWFFVR